MDIRVRKYIKSWIKFHDYCEEKSKGKCKLNGNAWRKLREYHLNNFVSNLNDSFLFLRFLKYRHPNIYYNISGIEKIYNKYLQQQKDMV